MCRQRPANARRRRWNRRVIITSNLIKAVGYTKIIGIVTNIEAVDFVLYLESDRTT